MTMVLDSHVKIFVDKPIPTKTLKVQLVDAQQCFIYYRIVVKYKSIGFL